MVVSLKNSVVIGQNPTKLREIMKGKSKVVYGVCIPASIIKFLKEYGIEWKEREFIVAALYNHEKDRLEFIIRELGQKEKKVLMNEFK
ncbi:MAG: hypothetical protein QXY18_05770 [Nitrososphaerota archaeon]